MNAPTTSTGMLMIVIMPIMSIFLIRTGVEISLDVTARMMRLRYSERKHGKMLLLLLGSNSRSGG